MFSIYELLVAFFSLALRGFFREVKSRGSHKIPPSGPVIFCVAPHANQFVDPLMLLTNCGRRVGFLAAKKSMDKPHIGIPARIMGAIPVVRPQDLVKAGKGKIYMDTENPLILKGIDTEFTRVLHFRALIKLPQEAGAFEVVEVLSDTEVKIKRAVEGKEAVALLSSEGGTSYKVIPHVDQADMFNAVTERLERGDCVGIFPEGGSHDRPELLPLKAGVTIMALGAMYKNPDLNVQIVPVGLNYFHADKFRSRAVIEFGDPIQVPSELVAQYGKGGPEKRAACAILLDTIYTSLKAITTTAPDYDTLMVIQAARRLYKPPHKRLNLDQTLLLSRRFTEGYLKYRNDPRVQDLTGRVLEYNRLLSYYGIRDHQVQRTAVGRLWALSRLLARVIELLVFAFFGLPGLVLTAPIWHTARRVAAAKMVEAKAGSSVKIWGKDVVATWKVLTAVFLIPVFWFLYTLTSFLVSYFILDLGRRPSLIVTAVIATAIPLLTWATIHCYDHGADIFKSLRPLWMAVVAGSSAQPLRDMRQDLAERIARGIDELGPELYGPDFHSTRIVRAEDVDYGLRLSQKLRRGEGFQTQDFRWDEVDEREFSDDVFLFKDETRGVVQGVWGDVRQRRARSL
ncbi:uncharacterized protein SPPG_06264 [Spizellomyces punctatus DAOM BR117]|uniref:Phospholipid/glycerol acyltransferase domain-containing protein n=1 Tax=Spizellomyces punctatus (strain DAOM BR117) TaxID=645134 RepID=A0A0L0HCI3_SPIPD|nr:uncharacterized protein SPPG_06264 [Spizellomyces punctatus DAOM BR117]KNC98579.1 hypothetical protein SPPG_06264 [Spizellomyces punctatus DAOM BR117]|eukprot:XP_016606619.1 hypothetical protein SPPG_06264 [Spizellomyces punctatus DAOM BR117]